MKNIPSLVILISFCIPSVFAQGNAEQGKIVLNFQQEEQPVAGIAMTIDDTEQVITNANGVAEVIVSPGRRTVTLRRNDRELTALNVLLSNGEELTIFADVQAGADVPAIDYESTGIAGSTAGSDSGTITGHVTSGVSGEPVADAEIIILGAAVETQSDAEGRFTLEVPAGSYGLSVSHQEHRSFTVDHLVVVANEPVAVDAQLFPLMALDIADPLADMPMEEVVVTAGFIADEASIAGAIETVRLAPDISEIISADEMAAAGAGDAAAALERVTGITVQDDQFVNVRGLPERYTKTLWNGSELPSPDPNRRLVPLDLFPTDVLSAVQVQKTYSADQPGEFAGGLVNLQTASVPDEDFFKLSIGTEYNSETTGQTGLVYEGGDYDNLGFDDGTRELPDAIDEATRGGSVDLGPQSFLNPDGFTPEELERLGESFPNIYEIEEQTLEPDFSLAASGGKRWDRDWGDFGFLGAFIYDREWSHQEGPENTFGLTGGGLVPRDQFNERETEKEITLGGMFSLGLGLADHTQLTSNTFLIRKTTDGARIRDGIRSENDEVVREFTLEWVERELFSQQLIGEHTVPLLGNFELDIDWRAMYAKSRRDAPDRRFYRYTLQNDVFVFEESSIARDFSESEDTTRNVAFDLSLPLGEEGRLSTLLKTGWSYLNQERESDVQRFQFRFQGGSTPFDIATQPNPEGIFTSDNIGPDGFVIDDLTGANDDAEGEQTVTGGYLLADTYVFDLLRINTGVRYEQADLEVLTFQETPGGLENPVQADLDTAKTLPAVTATWFMTDTMQLRLGYGTTVSRPNLRELSPASYIDPVTDDAFIGNPDLEETEIESFDIRWEWYFGDAENLSVGLFYRDFESPIETVKIPGFNTPRTFQNADSAEAYGIEVGFRKNLDFLHEKLEDFFTYGNFSLIDSEVTISENTLFTNTNPTRELQGQAPYIVNMALGYSGFDTEATLLFNVVGERIAEVGVQGQPDIKEQPAPRLDFILSHQLTDSLNLKFAAKNLLNPRTEFKQGNETQRAYREGWSVGLSLSWEL